MHIIKTDGIILKTQDYTETSILVTLFTKQRGTVTLLAKGAHRKKSPFSGNLNLFAYGEFIYSLSSKSDIAILMECEITDFFLKLRTDILRFVYGCHIVELLSSLFPAIEETETLFHLSLATLAELDTTSPENIERLILFFEIQFLFALGFLPQFESCGNCSRSDAPYYWLIIQESLLLCPHCHEQRRTTELSPYGQPLPGIMINKSTIAVIHKITPSHADSWLKQKIDEQQLKELSTMARIFLDFNLQKQLKSLFFLKKFKRSFLR